MSGNILCTSEKVVMIVTIAITVLYPREVLYLAGGRQRACSSSGSCSQFLICLQSSSSSGTGVGAGQLTTTCHLNLPAGDSVAYCSACSPAVTCVYIHSSQSTKGDKLTTITCYLAFFVDKRGNSVVQISTLSVMTR